MRGATAARFATLLHGYERPCACFTTMTIFCCQIQIDRLSKLTERDIIEICARMDSGWSESVSYESGDDDGRYINLFIRTSDRTATWDRICAHLLGSEDPGAELRDAMIVTVTGNREWDDYGLLHHFDADVRTDTLG